MAAVLPSLHAGVFCAGICSDAVGLRVQAFALSAPSRFRTDPRRQDVDRAPPRSSGSFGGAATAAQNGHPPQPGRAAGFDSGCAAGRHGMDCAGHRQSDCCSCPSCFPKIPSFSSIASQQPPLGLLRFCLGWRGKLSSSLIPWRSIAFSVAEIHSGARLCSP